jgi:cell division septum initiation protein DivIVA
MPLRPRRKPDEDLIEGEPSMLGRRSERKGENGQEPEVHVEAASPIDSDGDVAPREEDTGTESRAPESVKDQLARLATQIRGLQQQVQELVARRSDAIAEQASERVAAIVQAAEESAAEITGQAHKESAELRERLCGEAQDEADRIRVDAQADAAKIRTAAHADAARLRDDALTELSREVDRICVELSHQLQTSARAAIEQVVRGPIGSTSIEPEAGATPEPDEAHTEVEAAVDELQSAAAVLEQSLRHLHEIGQGLPESE